MTKRALLLPFVLLCFTISCTKIESSIDGIYTGQASYEGIGQFNRKIKLKFEDGQFTDLMVGCNGEFTVKRREISFIPTGASCFCCINCSCIPQVFQSQFEAKQSGDSLKLSREVFGENGTLVQLIKIDLKKM